MKLELKHLAPYLPYNIQVQRLTDNPDWRPIEILNEETIQFWYAHNWERVYYKPILHPLSDLTKEIEVNEEKFVPIVEIGRMRPTGFQWTYYEEDNLLGSYDYDVRRIRGATLDQYQKLFEWHFDVFNLIPNGLAIDINTL